MKKVSTMLLSWVISLTLFSGLYAAQDHNASRSNNTSSVAAPETDKIGDIKGEANIKFDGVDGEVQDKTDKWGEIKGEATDEEKASDTLYVCEDGTAVENLSDCPFSQASEDTIIPQYPCPDGTVVSRWSDCPDEKIELKKMRTEKKEARKEYISAYKGAFVKRIGNRLDSIPTKNLETALEKINARMDDTEENENMSDGAKEVLMDALFALLEIVEDKIGWIDGE